MYQYEVAYDFIIGWGKVNMFTVGPAQIVNALPIIENTKEPNSELY
jgi:hypothetical protein